MQQLSDIITNCKLPSTPVINWIVITDPTPRFYNRKSEFLSRHQAIELHSLLESSIYTRIFGLVGHQPYVLVYDWTRNRNLGSYGVLLNNIMVGEVHSSDSVVRFKPPHVFVFSRVFPDTKLEIKKSSLNIIKLDNIE